MTKKVLNENGCIWIQKRNKKSKTFAISASISDDMIWPSTIRRMSQRHIQEFCSLNGRAANGRKDIKAIPHDMTLKALIISSEGTDSYISTISLKASGMWDHPSSGCRTWSAVRPKHKSISLENPRLQSIWYFTFSRFD